MRRARVMSHACLLLLSAAIAPSAAGQEQPGDDPASASQEQDNTAAFQDWLRSFSLATTDQVERRLTIDSMPGSPLMQWPESRGWNDWKERMHREQGLRWSVDYINAYMRATHSPGEKVGTGGALRFSGVWQLTEGEEGNSGALIWKIEHRHAYGSHVSPQGLAAEVGYAGLLHLTLSDQRGRLQISRQAAQGLVRHPYSA